MADPNPFQADPSTIGGIGTAPHMQAADATTRAVMAGNVLADAIPLGALAAHLFKAAGTQVLAASIAATLDPAAPTPVATGVCPACGRPPLASVVVGFMGADGARMAAVGTRARTAWPA